MTVLLLCHASVDSDFDVNTELDIFGRPVGKKPHTKAWLVAAVCCTFLPIAPVFYVRSQLQEVNEFTVLTILFPLAALLLLSCLWLGMWGIWLMQFIRARKFTRHQQLLNEIRSRANDG